MNINMPLYLRPNLEGELNRLGYDDTDRSLTLEFADQGFVVFDPEIPDFDRLASTIIGDAGSADRRASRLQDGWKTSGAIARLATWPKVLELLETLHGRKPFAFQTLNFPVGTQQPAHSDTIHFSSFPPDFMAGVWVALEDTDAGNGPLQYYPGSHRLPHLTLSEFGISGERKAGHSLYLSHYEPGVQELIAKHGLVPKAAHLKKGQALIWAANLLHGGSPILDANRTRHSQVTHYYFEGCRYWTPLHSDEKSRRIFWRYPFDVARRRPVVSVLGRSMRVPLPEPLLRLLLQVFG